MLCLSARAVPMVSCIQQAGVLQAWAPESILTAPPAQRNPHAARPMRACRSSSAHHPPSKRRTTTMPSAGPSHRPSPSSTPRRLAYSARCSATSAQSSSSLTPMVRLSSLLVRQTMVQLVACVHDTVMIRPQFCRRARAQRSNHDCTRCPFDCHLLVVRATRIAAGALPTLAMYPVPVPEGTRLHTTCMSL